MVIKTCILDLHFPRMDAINTLSCAYPSFMCLSYSGRDAVVVVPVVENVLQEIHVGTRASVQLYGG